MQRTSTQSVLRRLHESERIRMVLEKELLACRERIGQLHEKNEDLSLAINTLRNVHKKFMSEQAKSKSTQVKTLSVTKTNAGEI